LYNSQCILKQYLFKEKVRCRSPEGLREHKEKLFDLGQTISDILNRLQNFDEEIKNRIESPSYLSLIRKGFRSWDQADTQEKRSLIKNLLTNAGGTKLCPDQ